jgi:hypothetical protein
MLFRHTANLYKTVSGTQVPELGGFSTHTKLVGSQPKHSRRMQSTVLRISYSSLCMSEVDGATAAGWLYIGNGKRANDRAG